MDVFCVIGTVTLLLEVVNCTTPRESGLCNALRGILA
jgi:hypothetical protein